MPLMLIKTIGNAAMASFPTVKASMLAIATALANVGVGQAVGPRGQVADFSGVAHGPTIIVPFGVNDDFSQTVDVTAMRVKWQ